ncbi:hypothetical protein ACROYT_G014855 [Oculina patagonica]
MFVLPFLLHEQTPLAITPLLKTPSDSVQDSSHETAYLGMAAEDFFPGQVQDIGKWSAQCCRKKVVEDLILYCLTTSQGEKLCYEAADLLNERPIGQHPTSPDDTYDLLLGRSTSKIPNGPFTYSTDPRRRFEFIQMVTDNFWKKWTRDYFPSLLIQQKWHTAHKILKEGDVVLIQDSNLIRSQLKLGKLNCAVYLAKKAAVFNHDTLIVNQHANGKRSFVEAATSERQLSIDHLTFGAHVLNIRTKERKSAESEDVLILPVSTLLSYQTSFGGPQLLYSMPREGARSK